MSCETVVCRTCLATDIRMVNLCNTKLQVMFEKLTENKVASFDGSWVCYICCSQLQKCEQFHRMALRAERVLTQLQTTGIQLIPDSVIALRPTNSYLTTPVEYLTLPDPEVVSVKIEPIDIKDEEDIQLFRDLKVEELQTLEVDTEDFVMYEDYEDNIFTQTQENKCLDCNQCGKLFKSSDALKSHLNTHINICNDCNFESTDKIAFQRHLRKHTKPFYCDLCNKSFSEQSSLRKHVTTHSSQKPYQCDHCDKSFAHKTYLIQHIRALTQEKPFECDVCFKRFAQIGHLSTHKRTHYPKSAKTAAKNNLKVHKCLICNKDFTGGNVLNRHMKSHTGRRPYACEFCFKTFASNDTLKSHVRTHTGEKPFPCNVCGKCFTTSGNMTKHRKVHNNV